MIDAKSMRIVAYDPAKIITEVNRLFDVIKQSAEGGTRGSYGPNDRCEIEKPTNKVVLKMFKKELTKRGFKYKIDKSKYGYINITWHS